ncbi:MAG: hypothetical protein KC636_34135, partial [Myxococcales bacterium]|nr:hypothetical protein [Myxococcales bacterium]
MPDSDVPPDPTNETELPPAGKVPRLEKLKQKLPDLSIGQMTYLVLVASVAPAIVSAGISWGMLRAATQANEIAQNATSAARDASSAAKESAAAASASNKIASAALDVSKKSASAAESSAESASKAVLNAERADLLNLRGLVADETTAPGHRSRALIELAEIERKRYGGLLLSDHTFENVQIIDIDLSNARFTRVAIRKKQISNANLVDIEFNTTS